MIKEEITQTLIQLNNWTISTDEAIEEVCLLADKQAITFARYIADNYKIFNNSISMEMALNKFKTENELNG